MNNLLLKKEQLKKKIKKIKLIQKDSNIKRLYKNRMVNLMDLFLENKVTQFEIDNDYILNEFNIESDAEKYESEILNINREIEEIDPNCRAEGEDSFDILSFSNSFDFSVDIFRVYEPLFYPKILGINQIGIVQQLIQISEWVPKEYNIFNNIILEGGGSNINNLENRLKRDVR